MTNTGEAVKAIREKLGISQQELSNRLGVGLMTVSRWERNLYTPEAEKLAVLAGMARELGLADAAEVMDRECGRLFRDLGQIMLQRIWHDFVVIRGNISEFAAKVEQAGLAKDIPTDLWALLHKSITKAQEGMDTTKNLIAMAPHVGSQKEVAGS